MASVYPTVAGPSWLLQQQGGLLARSDPAGLERVTQNSEHVLCARLTQLFHSGVLSPKRYKFMDSSVLPPHQDIKALTESLSFLDQPIDFLKRKFSAWGQGRSVLCNP